MVTLNKLPDFTGHWPVALLEAMDKLWEAGVTPTLYRDLWVEQADHQGLEHDEYA